jgi:hypothetical protein
MNEVRVFPQTLGTHIAWIYTNSDPLLLCNYCKYQTTELRANKQDRAKTDAFGMHHGLFEYVRLPMGLKNSPSIFQRLMNL